MKRNIIIISIILIVFLIVLVFCLKLNKDKNSQENIDTPIEVTDKIFTKNQPGSYAKFYYYIPAKLKKEKKPYPLIVTLPGDSIDGKDAVYDELINLAESKGYAIFCAYICYRRRRF